MPGKRGGGGYQSRPAGFRRASGGVSEQQDAARRKRVQREKERIAREAREAKRKDRAAAIWAAPRTGPWAPKALRQKPKPKKTRPRTFAQDVEYRETFTPSGKRRLATKKQRRKLASAQSAKRKRLERLAERRTFGLDLGKQPTTITGKPVPGHTQYQEISGRSPELRKKFLNITRAAARGDISPIEASRRLHRLGLQDVGKDPGRSHLGYGGPAEQFMWNLMQGAKNSPKQLAEIGIGLGALPIVAAAKTGQSIYERSPDPLVEAAKETGQAQLDWYKGYQHPGKQVSQGLVLPILDAWGGKALLGRITGTAGRAAIRALPRNVRVVEGGTIQHPTRSRVPMVAKWEDKYDNYSARHPEARVVGSQARGARIKAKELKREERQAHARMARKAKGPKRLSFHPLKNDRQRFRLAVEAQLSPERRAQPGWERVAAARLRQMADEPVRPIRTVKKEIDRLKKENKHDRNRLRAAVKAEPDEVIYARIEGRDAQIAALRGGPRLTKERARERIQGPEKTLTPAEQTKRRADLHRKARILEAAADEPRSPRYMAALETLADMAAEEKAIKLRAGLLDEESAVGAERDFEAYMFGEALGEGIHMRHTAREGKTGRFGGRVGGGRISTRDMGLQNRELILLQEGRVRFDPDVSVESWTRAQTFQWHNDFKQWMLDNSSPIDLTTGPNEGWPLVNPMGKVIPRKWREKDLADEEGRIDPGEATGDPLLDDDAMIGALKEYVSNYVFAPSKDTPKPKGPVWLDEDGDYHPHIRQVPPELIKQVQNELFPEQMVGGKGAVTAVDLVNGLVKISLLYGNPGYVPAALAGNLMFGVYHQGAWLPKSLWDTATLYTRDRVLFDRLAGLSGSGPTVAASSARDVRNVQGWARGIIRAESAVARTVGSVADVGPRVAAILFEARKKGYKTDDDLYRMLDDPNVVLDRNEISDRGTKVMVDFDTLRPWEQGWVRRFLFVWPWIRGNINWAGYMPKEYPVRSALIAQSAQERGEMIQEQVGQTPSWLQVVPTGPTEGGTFPGVSTGSITPTGSALQMGRAIGAWMQGMALDEAVARGLVPMAWMNPLIESGSRFAQSQGKFGQPTGLRTSAVENFADLLIPGFGPARQVIQPGTASDVYADHSRGAALRRAGIRFAPQRFNVKEIHEAAERETAASGDPKAIRVGKSENLTLKQWEQRARRFARKAGPDWMRDLPNARRLARLKVAELEATRKLEGQEKTMEFLDVVGGEITPEDLVRERAAVRRLPDAEQGDYLTRLREWVFADLSYWNHYMAEG